MQTGSKASLCGERRPETHPWPHHSSRRDSIQFNSILAAWLADIDASYHAFILSGLSGHSLLPAPFLFTRTTDTPHHQHRIPSIASWYFTVGSRISGNYTVACTAVCTVQCFDTLGYEASSTPDSYPHRRGQWFPREYVPPLSRLPPSVSQRPKHTSQKARDNCSYKCIRAYSWSSRLDWYGKPLDFGYRRKKSWAGHWAWTQFGGRPHGLRGNRSS